jgi:hypothetical protein
MTVATLEISEDAFDARFPLRRNHLNPNAGWVLGEGRGCLFETYGKELAFVRKQDPRAVWTLVNCDESDWLISGFRLVNRVGYLISTVLRPDDADIEVRLETIPSMQNHQQKEA